LNGRALSLCSLDNHHIGAGVFVPQGARRGVFGRIEPGFCPFQRLEFQDDQPFGMPVAFQGFVVATARQITPAIALYGRRR